MLSYLANYLIFSKLILTRPDPANLALALVQLAFH